MVREKLEFDVVIVGAGPAGLSAACRLMQMAEGSAALTVCVIEKGAEIGAHSLSGAVMETRALDELFPDWRERGAPLTTQVQHDEVIWLKNEQAAWQVPPLFLPKGMANQGNYLVSQSKLCRWLAQQAETLGVEVFTGFTAKALIFDESGCETSDVGKGYVDKDHADKSTIHKKRVSGVITGDMGLNAASQPKPGHMQGIELRGKYTVFAEGSRGHLGKQLIDHYALARDADAQHYSLGLKEIWEIDPALHQQGVAIHHFGWPLCGESKGGSFLYFMEENQMAVGLVVDLDYRNAYLSPFDEFQRMKHHPSIAKFLRGGRRISYGARTLTKGGYYALPRMTFPGGLLIGCNAGLLNGAKLKGIHTAMKSGMLAAETIYEALREGDMGGQDLVVFAERLKQSWVGEELYAARNFCAAIKWLGPFVGGIFNGIDQRWFGGQLPFKLRNNQADHTQMKPITQCRAIDYPQPDNQLSFDKMSSVYLSHVEHEGDQPCHLHLSDPMVPLTDNLVVYDEPAQRYCPAGVYNIVETEHGKQFIIDAQNCLHCKTCDIKDPAQNITWTPPEGGGGPGYTKM